MKYLVDFSGLGSLIGAVEGAEEIANSDQYMQSLVESAFEHADNEFIMEVASTATATHTLNHMFEFGTAGINTARTNRRMNPMSPESHLWHTELDGKGKNMGVKFEFLPAKVLTPLPTTARTGIAQKYLSKLTSRSVFWNKAAVMESGMEVTIKPKEGGKLFIPHMGNPPEGARPADIAKGFTMYGYPVTFTPGEHHAGTFTTFWSEFWNGRGAEQMQNHAEAQFSADMDRLVAEANKTKGRFGPPSATKFKGEVKEGKSKGEATMMRAAERRRKT